MQCTVYTAKILHLHCHWQIGREILELIVFLELHNLNLWKLSPTVLADDC